MDSWIMIVLLYLYHFYNEVIVAIAVRLHYLLLELFCHNHLNKYRDLHHVKTPKHIAMSLTNEANHLDLQSVAKLYCWSKLIGTRYVTLYDELGKLKDSQKELLKYIEYELENIGCEKPIRFLDGLDVISRTDGAQRYLDHIRKLVKLKPDEIDYDLVNESLGWSSDPELLISFGSPLKLYGFPPWPLRLTEIFHIPTHRSIPQKIFVDILKKYSRTTQREGT